MNIKYSILTAVVSVPLLAACSTSSSESALNEITDAYHLKDWQSILKVYDNLPSDLKKTVSDNGASLAVTEAMISEGRVREGLEYVRLYKNSSRVRPEYIYMDIARAYRALGMTDSAFHFYDVASKINPCYARPPFEAATLLEQIPDSLPVALALYDETLALFESNGMYDNVFMIFDRLDALGAYGRYASFLQENYTNYAISLRHVAVIDSLCTDVRTVPSANGAVSDTTYDYEKFVQLVDNRIAAGIRVDAVLPNYVSILCHFGMADKAKRVASDFQNVHGVSFAMYSSLMELGDTASAIPFLATTILSSPMPFTSMPLSVVDYYASHGERADAFAFAGMIWPSLEKYRVCNEMDNIVKSLRAYFPDDSRLESLSYRALKARKDWLAVFRAEGLDASVALFSDASDE
ncbi:MAG: hypothetical protein II951_01380 [Bacteroidales bacterium]|nr:hypothetical protein [Bacteroidales bacterium]